MSQNYLNRFMGDLLDRSGYEKAPREVKDQLQKDLKERLDRFVLTRIISQFSKEELEEYETLLDENKSTEELTEFAKNHISDYKTFMTSTILLFQDAYLS